MIAATRSGSVASGVLQLHWRKLKRQLGHALPPLLIPLFFFAAFAGALGAIGNTEGFEYYSYTAFQFVFVFFLTMIFCGVFTAMDIGGFYEAGMGRRLMLATPRRMAIVGGFLLSGILRGVLFGAIVWAIALASGMDVPGSPLDVAALLALGLLLNVATTLYGAGVALRLRTRAAGALILLPTYMAIFLTPIFSTRDQLTGWVATVADVNPLTAVLESGRGFLAGETESVALAFGVAAGLVIVFSAFAVRGMRSAERNF